MGFTCVQQERQAVLCCSPTEQVLPMLRFVQRRGNSTVYEWRMGTEPSVVERPHLEELPEQVEEDMVRQTWREPCPHAPQLHLYLSAESQKEESRIWVRETLAGRAQKALLYFSRLLEARAEMSVVETQQAG